MKRIAIVGATGAVGAELLEILEQRAFPISSLSLFSSSRSAGKKLSFKGEEHIVQEATVENLKGFDILLFSAGGSTSRKLAPEVAKDGGVVVDNSSAFRMDPQVPLVIPEINSDAVKEHRGIIANPNCSTIIFLMGTAPLHRAAGLKRAVVSTYQAISGAGAQAMEEMRQQAADVLAGRKVTPKVIPYPTAFNAFLHNSPLDPETLTCEEERKMSNESKKILGDDSPKFATTCVRVSTFRAHSIAANLQFENAITADEARQVLAGAKGVRVEEDIPNNRFPTPLDASGIDDVLVGRVRTDPTQANTLDLWMVGDQLRKGAALNAVQIAELL